VGSGGVTFGRSLQSGGRFCVDAFGRNLACHHEDMVTYNLLYEDVL
jgi:hypothetical protein